MSVEERDESGVGSPARRRHYPWFDLGLYFLLKTLSRIVAIVLFDVRVYNTHKIPRGRNFLLAPNHLSFLDPWIVGLATPSVLTYLARENLLRIPLLGRLLRHLNTRPVKRETSAARQGIQGSVDALDQGCSLVLFPEGTRSPDGRLGAIKRGITLVVRRTHCLVVPACIDGTFEIWPRGQRIPLPGHVRIDYGDPIWYDGSDKRAAPAVQTAEKVKIPDRANEKSSGDLQSLVENGWAQGSAESSADGEIERPLADGPLADRAVADGTALNGPDGPSRRAAPASPHSSRKESSAMFLEALGQAYRVLQAEARCRRWYRDSPRRNSDAPPDFAGTTFQ